MRRILAYATLALALGAGLTSCRGPGQPAGRGAAPIAAAPAPVATTPTSEAPAVVGDVVVFYPCGMIGPINAVLERLEAVSPKLTVTRVYDNADVLVKRIIEKGEHADVVITPGDTEMARLEQAGKVAPGAKRPFGTFDLVAVVNRESGIAVTKPEDLLTCSTITIPEPGRNSVGDAAKESLTKLGLWDQISAKAVFTDHPIKSYELVSSRKADVALTWNACPLDTNPEKMSADVVRIAFSFPRETYQVQHCWVAPLSAAADMAAARAFVDFVVSPATLQLLADNGVAGAGELIGAHGDAPASESPAAPPAESGTGGEVQVQIFYPGDQGHLALRELAGKINSRYPGKAHAVFIDFGSAEGSKLWKAAGLSCGSVVIDGKVDWEIEEPAGKRSVGFRQKMGVMWQEEDLYRVLDQLTGMKTVK